MGLSNYIKNKAKETVNNMKAEREHQREERLENRNQYEKGYREGQYKRGQLEGAGQIVPAAKQQGGRTQGRGGFTSTMKHSDDIFGWSGGAGGLGGGIGFDMFGSGEPKRAAPPVRTRTIMPNGKVVIQEPIQPQQHQPQENPYDFWGSPGAAGGNGKKREKHPYDIF